MNNRSSARGAFRSRERAFRRTAVAEGTLGISVESDLAEARLSLEGDLAGVRKRLAHLYRERGRLDVSTGAGKRRAVMEIPL